MSELETIPLPPFPIPHLGKGVFRFCIAFVMLAALLCGCLPDPAAPLPTTVDSPATDWYTVYFSDPGGPNARSLRGGPDKHLAEAIDQARLSVDIAAYDLDLWSIRDALLAAHRRGAAVRLVTDSDYIDNPEVQALKDAGVPVLGDRREGLMHDKFVVIDRLEVWTGSMNYTVNDAYRNNNNLIRVRSAKLAEDYRTEFNEMFGDDLFGPSTRAATPHTTLEVEGTLLEVYFSPDDGTAAHLIQLIQSAQKSIYFLAYSFTSDDLAQAVRQRAAQGITVAGVMEAAQVESNQGGEYGRFRKAGLDVRLDGNSHNMHHKILIIDDQIVVTGSYNFSSSAETTNDENTLVIHNPQIAALYRAEFDKVFKMSQ
jgi:phosphatidylserine/phosphatidylglycerophosphate/cardiolipin synthase-like enzyme